MALADDHRDQKSDRIASQQSGPGPKEPAMSNPKFVRGRSTVTTAAIILSLAAAGAPTASAMPADDYAPTAKPAPTRVYDRPDREMVPPAATYGADVAQATIPQPVVRAQAPKSGFDWGDAGIGAAGLALSAIGVGGAFAATQRRSRRTTALPN
jgi:hypothetical protein